MTEPLTSADSTETSIDWRLASVAVALYCGAMLYLFADTLLSIEAIWARSDTFAHGYLILPISAWLIYRQKALLRHLQPEASFIALLFLLPSMLLWVAGSLVNVLVVQQVALVAILVTGLWVILGNRVARAIAFPLGFLFLAVPMGLGLIPPMQEFTATATVRMVEWSGVPVYRDGMYFSLPTGNWRVVEACSGVRYLIASFTLGVLYAYLSYSSRWKQLLFILLSLLVPIVANALRAYLIVMLGHLSSGKLAAGVDHLIYGWVFFGLVMLLLFWVGSFWSETTNNEDRIEKYRSNLSVSSRAQHLSVVAVAILLIWSGQALVKAVELNSKVLASQAMMALPVGSDEWQTSEGIAPWQPLRAGASQIAEQRYSQGDSHLYLLVQHHPGTTVAGAEAIVDFKRLVGNQADWRVMTSGWRQVILKDRKFTVAESLIDNGHHRLRVWYWYKLGPHVTANRYLAKLYELWLKLLEGQSYSDRILLLSADDLERDSAAEMKRFLEQHRALVGQHDS